MLKRAFDLIGAGSGILVVSPVLLLVGVLVRATLGRPVLFAQMRPGLHGRPFRMYKFRTMREALDASGHPLPDDQRLTSLGRWLRSTSLDELPELWNVLRGDMSLVGPRPLLMHYIDRYTSRQARRHEVRPGITGWAQVNGRNAILWNEKLELDIWYVENQSFWIDLKVLALTLLRVLRRDGVASPDHATMPEFLGSDDLSSDRKLSAHNEAKQ